LDQIKSDTLSLLKVKNLNRTHQILIYADNINLLGKNKHKEKHKNSITSTDQKLLCPIQFQLLLISLIFLMVYSKGKLKININKAPPLSQ